MRKYFVHNSFVILIFFCIGLTNIVNHEMWRDELQAWSIAKDSISLKYLFDNLRYESQPGLWHLCLYALTRFSDYPIFMQIFHLILATITVYIFINYSPFTKSQKVLFAFGYFPFFEYATISRNYGIGILLLFLFCSLIKTKNYLHLSIILFLLSQTNIYGLIIAIVLGLMLFIEYANDLNVQKALGVRKVIISIGIYISGVVISILQVIPPSDSGVDNGWQTAVVVSDIVKTISTIWNSYIPVPNLEYHFWNTNIISSPPFQLFLSILLLSFSLVLFIRTPLVLFLYSFGTIGLLLFFYMKFFGYLRHHGHLFVLFVVSLWLSAHYRETDLKWGLINRLSTLFFRYKNTFFTLILFANLIAGVYANIMDWFFPFSASKEVSRFIKDNQIYNLPILGEGDSTTSAVSGHLNKKIFYPRANRFGSFIVWNNQRGSQSFALKAQEEWITQQRGNILLLLDYELSVSIIEIRGFKYNVDKIRGFDAGIVKDEKYYIYTMSRQEP